jgi:hypothetical protein
MPGPPGRRLTTDGGLPLQRLVTYPERPADLADPHGLTSRRIAQAVIKCECDEVAATRLRPVMRKIKERERITAARYGDSDRAGSHRAQPIKGCEIGR